MQQTIERAKARPRPGFLRRFLVRNAGKRSEPASPPADPATSTRVIDLHEDLPAAQWRAVVSERLERLETGVSLVAETMKRAFIQVFRSIEDRRGAPSGPDGELERIVADSFSSLESAVDDLAESIRQVPFVLAAAAEDITAKLGATSSIVGVDDGSQPIPAITSPSAPPEPLPATPFELEPVEEQFLPMDEGPAGLEARRIWGSSG